MGTRPHRLPPFFVTTKTSHFPNPEPWVCGRSRVTSSWIAAFTFPTALRPTPRTSLPLFFNSCHKRAALAPRTIKMSPTAGCRTSSLCPLACGPSGFGLNQMDRASLWNKGEPDFRAYQGALSKLRKALSKVRRPATCRASPFARPRWSVLFPTNRGM